jgi:hypothetical protein
MVGAFEKMTTVSDIYLRRRRKRRALKGLTILVGRKIAKPTKTLGQNQKAEDPVKLY